MLSYSEGEGIATKKAQNIVLLGIILICFGFIILVIASIFSGGEGSVTGIILIGPIPIFLGANSNLNAVILISIFIFLVGITIFVLLNRGASKVY
ncbi:MAG: hypothetical protein PHC63_00685 [Candidatus Bathyarchaeota archaeon]|nr:hypothetical protein [Candidatus Bathyarchaeota archaeon]